MAVTNKKIPIFNDTFDVSKISQVLKKNIIYYILIAIIAATSGFVYLRYTSPVYEAYTVLQVNEEQNQSFVNVENVYGNTSIPKLIELLRAFEFLKRTITKLNLTTSYYLEGKFLETELYKNAPFFVETENFPNNYKNSKIYVSYDNETGDIILNLNEKEKKDAGIRIKRNTWTNFFGGKIYINITNLENLKAKTDAEYGNKIYFTIYDDAGAFRKHLLGLDIMLLNSNAGTIKINYHSNNPQKTADIVNAISKDFLTYNIEKKQERAEKVLEFIENQLQIVYKKLNESENQLQNFKKTYNLVGNILNDESIVAQSMREQNEELSLFNDRLTYLNKLENQISQKGDINTVELLTLLSATPSESMIINFLQGIQQLQTQRDKLLINVTEDNYEVKKITKQIEEQKAILNDITELSIERLKSDIEAANIMVEKSEIIDIDEIELTKLQRVHKVNQNFYNQLIERRAEYMISKAGHVTNNLILQKAVAPKKPISPNVPYVILTTILLGLLSMVILTLVTYMFHNEIMSLGDISRFTDAPISGVIPITKETNKINRFVVENKATSVITEAFRTLRSNLEFIHQDTKDPLIIAITSTISGEGKTFIAINLGGVIALSGKRVVLLDLDLRKPKVHLTFKATNDKGLSTILIGKDKYQDCIIKTEFENFDIITSGPPPPNPAELANSVKFDNLLLELKKDYDMVIVDTPPIGIVSDAIFSFKRADLPVYVTRANYSKRNFINNVNYIKEHKKIHNVSVVLNAVEIVSAKFGYGYKSYGYDGYGYGYGFGYGYYSYGEDSKKKSKKGLAKFFSKS